MYCGLSVTVTCFQEEQRRIQQEEQEQREQEEYLKLKEGFVVEEEGLDVKDDDTTEVCYSSILFKSSQDLVFHRQRVLQTSSTT